MLINLAAAGAFLLTGRSRVSLLLVYCRKIINDHLNEKFKKIHRDSALKRFQRNPLESGEWSSASKKPGRGGKLSLALFRRSRSTSIKPAISRLRWTWRRQDGRMINDCFD